MEKMFCLGKRIKTRRVEIGWTLTQLALKTGISKSFLSELENGKKSLGVENFFKISRALGVPLGSMDWQNFYECFKEFLKDKGYPETSVGNATND